MQPQFSTSEFSPDKRCPKCHAVKPIDQFWRDAGEKGGIRCRCIECCRAASLAYRNRNREKLAARQREFRAKNLEKCLARNAAWRAKDHAHYLEVAKRQRDKNPERTREIRRRFRQTEKGKILKRANTQRRRNALGRLKASDVRRQYHAQRGKCYFCSQPVGQEYHLDHLVPIIRGGSNHPSNIVIACPTCNLRKGDKCPWEWEAGGRLC